MKSVCHLSQLFLLTTKSGLLVGCVTAPFAMWDAKIRGQGAASGSGGQDEDVVVSSAMGLQGPG